LLLATRSTRFPARIGGRAPIPSSGITPSIIRYRSCGTFSRNASVSGRRGASGSPRGVEGRWTRRPNGSSGQTAYEKKGISPPRLNQRRGTLDVDGVASNSTGGCGRGLPERNSTHAGGWSSPSTGPRGQGKPSFGLRDWRAS